MVYDNTQTVTHVVIHYKDQLPGINPRCWSFWSIMIAMNN